MKVSELFPIRQCENTQVPESLVNTDSTTKRNACDCQTLEEENTSHDLQKRSFYIFLVDIISIVA